MEDESSDVPLFRQIVRANREAAESSMLFSRENRNKVTFILGSALAVFTLVGTIVTATTVVVGMRNALISVKDDLTTTRTALATAEGKTEAVKVQAAALDVLVKESKSEIDRRKPILDGVAEYTAGLKQYDWKRIVEEHQHVWALNQFGINNDEDFVRAHGYRPAHPEPPKK